MREEFIKLYSEEKPKGENLQINIQPFKINDQTPSEEEIKKAVMKMKLNKSPGATGIRVEHLREWMKGSENGQKNRTRSMEKGNTSNQRGFLWTNAEIVWTWNPGNDSKKRTWTISWDRFIGDHLQINFGNYQ